MPKRSKWLDYTQEQLDALEPIETRFVENPKTWSIPIDKYITMGDMLYKLEGNILKIYSLNK